jgi:hypothetical protein
MHVDTNSNGSPKNFELECALPIDDKYFPPSKFGNVDLQMIHLSLPKADVVKGQIVYLKIDPDFVSSTNLFGGLAITVHDKRFATGQQGHDFRLNGGTFAIEAIDLKQRVITAFLSADFFDIDQPKPPDRIDPQLRMRFKLGY